MAEHGVRFVAHAHRGAQGPRAQERSAGSSSCPLAFVHSLWLLACDSGRPWSSGSAATAPAPSSCWPPGSACRPLILEQNARPGFTNRLLARQRAAKAVVAFAATLPVFKGKGVGLGNPVRDGVLRSARRSRGRRRLDVLVFGGSQGSRFLNERVAAALPLLAAAKDRLRARPTRPAQNDLEPGPAAAYRRERLRRAPGSRPISPTCPPAFGQADLVVCRAGATTLRRAHRRPQGRPARPLRRGVRRPPDRQRPRARPRRRAPRSWPRPKPRPSASPGASCASSTIPRELDAMERGRRPPPGRGRRRPDRRPLPVPDEAGVRKENPA